MTQPRTSFCHGCERAGTCQFGIVSLWLDSDGVGRARIRVQDNMQGAPGVAHGGWTAAMFDEVLGRVPHMYGELAVTKSLTVEYTRPVPVNRWLRARAGVDSHADGIWHLSGTIALESTDVELARASGIWVDRTKGHFDRHREWLQEQDATATGPDVA
jgi:acyl-coenzyme A thioesterase PaaI-like protein